MARRASSSVNPVWLIVAAVLVAAGIGAVVLLRNAVTDPFRTLSVFPVEEYEANANALRGNVYKLECVVGDQLAYNNAGRLFTVEASGVRLGLVVPVALREVNIQKGQRFSFKVEVVERGVVRALEARKS